MQELYCETTYPVLKTFFDFSFAQALLLYAYIPIIIISLLIGILVLRSDHRSLRSKLLFGIALSFAFWVINIIFQWVAVYSRVVFFTSQMTAVFEISIFLLSIYFIDVFVNKKNSSFKMRALLSSILFIVLILVPTKINMSYFDIVNCEGVVGILWDAIYLFEILAIALIIYMGVKAMKNPNMDSVERKEITIVTIGMSVFLGIFSASNIFGEVLKTYSINLVGPIGMVIFLSLLVYMIVKFRAFNIKLLGAQALVISLIILIAATLLVKDPFYLQVIMATTLILVIGLGYSLTQSVKKEVIQREKIEKLARELGEANEKLKELDQLKSEFLSLATHQIRAPLTAIKGYSSMLLEGDFGVLPQKAKDSIDTIMKSCQNLINIVGDFLNISRIEQGRMVYEKSIFDIGELVQEVANELKPNIQNAGLSLEIEIPNNFSAKVNADKGKIKQVIGNIIDNAIKYTPHGNIKVSIFKEQNKIKIAVKDSGVGIDPSEIDKLFTKFSRTKDASKTNVTGTGLGLYIAKKMAEAHQGDIKVSSEGVGKGTTFTIELPIV